MTYGYMIWPAVFPPSLRSTPQGTAILSGLQTAARLSSSRTAKGPYNLYRKAANGAGTDEVLYADEFDKVPWGWSPDGKFLLYTSNTNTKTGNDVWALPLGEQPGGAPLKPFPFVQTLLDDRHPQFSPNTTGPRWVAYASNESQRPEVYIAPFPGPGGKRQFSTAGGNFPRWRRDGREIFFADLDGQLMGVEISIKESGIEVAQARSVGIQIDITRGYVYDLSLDGRKILAPARPAQKSVLPLTLVQNWTALLRK
jgi:eukaryotic-like serine/threonine-protein kinase